MTVYPNNLSQVAIVVCVCIEIGTVGSQLSVSERLDVAMFLAAAGEKCSGHWSSATGEIKAAI